MNNLQIIHFDAAESAKPFKVNGHTYIAEDVQTHIKKSGSIKADVITGFTCSKFSREVIDQVEGLKMIVTRSIGYDNIDQEYCKQKGIKFSNIDYSRHTVAHHTWALILHAVRSLNSCFDQTKNGNFCDEIIDCLDLRQMTLGIIGFGKIAIEVYKIAKVFGIKVIAYDIKPNEDFAKENTKGFRYTDLETVLATSDIISIHCDANPTSIDMINEQTINLMKQGVILINTARGSIIDENALIENIEKFSYVGLDVVIDEDSFNKENPLLNYPNIFITPHIAHKSPMTIEERWINTYALIEEFINNYNGNGILK